jgi:hypothetical protein
MLNTKVGKYLSSTYIEDLDITCNTTVRLVRVYRLDVLRPPWCKCLLLTGSALVLGCIEPDPFGCLQEGLAMSCK